MGKLFLDLPPEVRRIIYGHLFDKEYIIIPYPQKCRYPELEARPARNVFNHPDPDNLHVYGINSATCMWTVRHVPSADFIAMRFDYDVPERRSSVSSSGVRRLDGDYPWPLGATCRRIHDEVLDFVLSVRTTFAFASYRSLSRWLAETDPSVLSRVRTVKFEMHLSVPEPPASETADTDNTGSSYIVKEDRAWFDALETARQRLTGLRAFSMYVELCGPPLSATQSFGPFHRIPLASDRLKKAFTAAAEHVLDEATALVPDGGTDAREPSAEKANSSRLRSRHVALNAVQRYRRTGPVREYEEEGGFSRNDMFDWRCSGRDFTLGAELEQRCAALEIMPDWQAAYWVGKYAMREKTAQ